MPGSIDGTVVNAGSGSVAGQVALHDQAVALDRLDVRGAADQRDVVEFRKSGAVGAADRAGAEDDDLHRPQSSYSALMPDRIQRGGAAGRE